MFRCNYHKKLAKYRNGGRHQIRKNNAALKEALTATELHAIWVGEGLDRVCFLFSQFKRLYQRWNNTKKKLKLPDYVRKNVRF